MRPWPAGWPLGHKARKVHRVARAHRVHLAPTELLDRLVRRGQLA